jgi:sugar phosphate isomerase/epimerase
MPTPIALQLYTVRDQLAKDFSGVVRRIAAMGYVGVETVAFPGTTPREAARLFADLGLAVCSAHLPLPLGEKKNEVLDTLAALGCQRLVLGGTPRDLNTLEKVARACDSFNEANAVAASNGLSFGIHNHWWEFQRVEDGRTTFEVMRERLDPAVFFEVDVYWAKTGGADPVVLVPELGRRAPLLHLKDGPCVVGQPMVAVGSGTLDFRAIVAAGAGATEWLIVELDECATDMLAAVEKSYTYLVGEGMARGNKM